MNKAIFLDRDGTINKEVNYLYKKEDFEFIKNTSEAIKIFRNLGYLVIVVTNQAGIARGFYKEEDVKILHSYIDNLLKLDNTYIDAYYYCPHHPNGIIKRYQKNCKCRKPNIGMIEMAVVDFDIDLRNSVIVGDKEVDILAGKNAGIGKCILVKTGHEICEKNTKADFTYENMYEFAMTLLNDFKL